MTTTNIRTTSKPESETTAIMKAALKNRLLIPEGWSETPHQKRKLMHGAVTDTRLPYDHREILAIKDREIISNCTVALREIQTALAAKGFRSILQEHRAPDYTGPDYSIQYQDHRRLNRQLVPYGCKLGFNSERDFRRRAVPLMADLLANGIGLVEAGGIEGVNISDSSQYHIPQSLPGNAFTVMPVALITDPEFVAQIIERRLKPGTYRIEYLQWDSRGGLF